MKLNLDPFYWGGRLLKAIVNFFKHLVGVKTEEKAKPAPKKTNEEIDAEVGSLLDLASSASIIVSKEQQAHQNLLPDQDDYNFDDLDECVRFVRDSGVSEKIGYQEVVTHLRNLGMETSLAEYVANNATMPKKMRTKRASDDPQSAYLEVTNLLSSMVWDEYDGRVINTLEEGFNKKVELINIVRHQTGVGLKEAKNLVDKANLHHKALIAENC